jgi:hypothetical protein
MGMSDPVVWGSIGAVVISVVILVFLIMKIKALIEKDSSTHKD